MKNVRILPTPNESRLYYNSQEKAYQLCEFPKYHTDIKSTHNIYITNDEEIKEVKNKSWYLNIHKNDVLSIGEDVVNKNNWREIILTTDLDLIKDSVQAIDDEFLEWFVKNPSCENVEILIEKRTWKENNWVFYYKIIIPKEEPKQFKKK